MNDLTQVNGNAVSTVTSKEDLMAQFNRGVATSQLTPTLILLTQALSSAVEEGKVTAGCFIKHENAEIVAERETPFEFIPVARSTYYDKKEGQSWLGKEYVMEFDNREYDKNGQYSYDKCSDFVLFTVDQIKNNVRVPCTFAFKSANEKSCQPMLKTLDSLSMGDWHTKVFSMASIPKKNKAGKAYYSCRVEYVRDATKEELAFMAPLAASIVPAIGEQQVNGVLAVKEEASVTDQLRKF